MSEIAITTSKTDAIASDYMLLAFEEARTYFHQGFATAPNCEDYVTLMCSIHASFPENCHNCIGCNLERDVLRIQRFLDRLVSPVRLYKTEAEIGTETVGRPMAEIDLESDYPLFVQCLVYLIDSIDAYVKMIDQRLVEDSKIETVKAVRVIRWWGNFFRHPKGFLLAHHPSFTFEERGHKDCNVIDTAFVRDHYSAANKNDRGIDNKVKHKGAAVVVILPMPLKLVEATVQYAKWFHTLVVENPFLREHYLGHLTIDINFDMVQEE